MIQKPDFSDYGKYTMVDILQWRADNQSDRIAYNFLPDGENNEQSLTYRQLDQRVRSVAAVLSTYGKPGDRVMILLHPGFDFITAYYACLYSRRVAIPLYPPQRARMDKTLERLGGVASNAQPVVVLTNQTIKDIAPQLAEHEPVLNTMPWQTIEEALQESPSTWKDMGAKPDDLAFLQYTSGSTSDPKGVMVSNSNLVHNSHVIYTKFGNHSDSHGVVWLPPYHDMGLIGGIVQPLFGGFTVTLIPPIYFLQRPYRWLKAVTNKKATIAGGPNFAFDYCVEKIRPDQMEKIDLSSLEVMFSGAEPIHPETLRRFTEKFSAVGYDEKIFLPCFGLAEATLFASGIDHTDTPVFSTFDGTALENHKVQPASPDKSHTRHLTGCGDAGPGLVIRIVDADNHQVCPEDTVGEIWVKGPSMAQGYWGMPEKSKESFDAWTSDTKEGPFMRTGDFGFFHEGQLYVTGRLKDLIIIDGANHYPQDIEWTAMNSHEDIKPHCVAAFSITENSSEKLVIMAEVERRVMKKGSENKEEEVTRAIRKSISKYHELKVSDVMLITTRIPKTTSGKIRRHQCKHDYLEAKKPVMAS